MQLLSQTISHAYRRSLPARLLIGLEAWGVEKPKEGAAGTNGQSAKGQQSATASTGRLAVLLGAEGTFQSVLCMDAVGQCLCVPQNADEPRSMTA